MNILVVEDDLKLANAMRRMLTEARHTVDTTEDGWAGRTLGAMGLYDVIILDRLLPSMDGLDVCRQIRATGIVTPILMCSARDDLEDCVAGLEAGADDYLAKPFAMQELLARVNALGRWSRRGDATAPRALHSTVDGAAPAPKQAMATRRMTGLTTHLRHAWVASRRWLWWREERGAVEGYAAVVGPHRLPAQYTQPSHHHTGERV